MQFYDFEVLKGEEIIAAEPYVPASRYKSRMAENCKNRQENSPAELPHLRARAR